MALNEKPERCEAFSITPAAARPRSTSGAFLDLSSWNIRKEQQNIGILLLDRDPLLADHDGRQRG